MHSKYLVVGSGPAGTSAAYALRGAGVTVLDVGQGYQGPQYRGKLYELKQDEHFIHDALIGPNFESLRNIFQTYRSPKLKGALMQFVTANAEQLLPVRATGFECTTSFARGGLANAWGCGVFRFNDSDLIDFPLRAAELTPYYDLLTEKIGISGADDELTPLFGSVANLQPPLRMDTGTGKLFARYKRSSLREKGLLLGRPRLAVLTKDHDGRSAYDYGALEFFCPHQPALYTPEFTLAEMIAEKSIQYVGGRLVQRFEEDGARTNVYCRNLETGAEERWSCERLILAAGPISTAKIVLASFSDCETKLPLLDNPTSYLPLIDPLRIGAPQEREVFPSCSLSGVYDNADARVQMSIYNLSGTLRSDFLMEFPLSLRGNLLASRYLVPALLMVQIFRADAPTESNFLRLAADGALQIEYRERFEGRVEEQLAALFRRLGYLAFARLSKKLPPGSSFHYAGTLPMRENPQKPYETDRNGALARVRSVSVVDASVFPRLPAKNHTFTVMANALRIGTLLREGKV